MTPMQALITLVNIAKNATLVAPPGGGQPQGLTFGDHANIGQAELVLQGFIAKHEPKGQDGENGQPAKTPSPAGGRKHGRR